MALADFVFVWIGGALLIGFFGFFAVVLTALARMVRFVLRAALPRDHDEDAATTSAAAAPRLCAQPRCGHLNPPGARYCARCGSSLGNQNDVERYG